jgi:hypothetical protein
MTNKTTVAAHWNTVEQLVGPDSRIVYITGGA